MREDDDIEKNFVLSLLKLLGYKFMSEWICNFARDYLNEHNWDAAFSINSPSNFTFHWNGKWNELLIAKVLVKHKLIPFKGMSKA